MEFHIKRNVLSDELGQLSSVVERRSPLPILENVLIQGNGDNKIKLTCTNMESTLTTEAPVEGIENPGSLCVPVRRLHDIVKLMPEGMLRVRQDTNNFVRVESGASKFRIPGAAPENFPPLQEGEGLTWLEIPSAYLKTIVNGVEFAMAPDDDSRFVLKGAKLEIDGTDVRMVTTDGRRIALAYGPLPVLTMDDLSVLVPERAVTELLRLISSYDGVVSAARDEGKIFFKAGKRLLSSRLLTGEFPAYQEVFSEYRYDQFATFNASELSRSIKRALLVAADINSSVGMRFNEGVLRLDAATAESGEVDESLPTDFNGPDTVLYVNAKYIADFLDVLGGKTVRLEIKDAELPLHLLGEKDGIEYEYIVMPLAVPTDQKGKTV